MRQVKGSSWGTLPHLPRKADGNVCWCEERRRIAAVNTPAPSLVPLRPWVCSGPPGRDRDEVGGWRRNLGCSAGTSATRLSAACPEWTRRLVGRPSRELMSCVRAAYGGQQVQYSTVERLDRRCGEQWAAPSFDPPGHRTLSSIILEFRHCPLQGLHLLFASLATNPSTAGELRWCSSPGEIVYSTLRCYHPHRSLSSSLLSSFSIPLSQYSSSTSPSSLPTQPNFSFQFQKDKNHQSR